MYAFWYDYVKPRYVEKQNWLYGYRQFHCIHLNRWCFKEIAEDFEIIFDISNYELDRLLPKGKNKKVIGLVKDDLGGKIMTKFVELITKTYSYLMVDGSEAKKGNKRHEKMCHQKKT